MKTRTPHAVTTGVVVRSLRPTDRDDVQSLHERMDQRDAYLRFFGARPKHLEDLAESLCRQDRTHCALGAFVGGTLVGVANYVSPVGQSDDGSPSVEFALVVDHEYQSHGIGTMLLSRLVEAARAHGIERMTAEVLAQNTVMLEVIRDRGWAHALRREGTTLHLDLDLDDDAQAGGPSVRRRSAAM
ncbi:GNAT family N-acetyltransferase [Rhodococcus sp. JVH1]|uniref:GNAT family N-acetyltransferase n=1 Tax=Rhodococcus sp. JVH1 TaxID=745408 RepID=UPI0002720CC2|nr:GNAT family N-acetyltransferase [Rhodococcus sp. JVH1]EJJ02088.1 acetyltransferase family protein [Rhodococcus sp. JVH1]